MNSARTRRLHRARQAAVVLTGIGVTATGAVAGLAHASPQVAASRTPATGSSSVASSSSAPSGSTVQPGIAGGAPQAQSGGS
jgi:hypothetical protein